MKRDLDLIRTILLKIEDDTKFDGSFQGVSPASFGIADHTDEEVLYHLIMLVEAGYVEGNTKLAQQTGHLVISKLTWEGHEFLDDIRDPEIWRSTKERAKTVAGLGLNFVWEIAKAEMKKTLGLS